MSRDFYKIEAKTALFCEKFHNNKKLRKIKYLNNPVSHTKFE
jgi:hypothetical protein